MQLGRWKTKTQSTAKRCPFLFQWKQKRRKMTPSPFSSMEDHLLQKLCNKSNKRDKSVSIETKEFSYKKATVLLGHHTQDFQEGTWLIINGVDKANEFAASDVPTDLHLESQWQPASLAGEQSDAFVRSSNPAHRAYGKQSCHAKKIIHVQGNRRALPSLLVIF